MIMTVNSSLRSLVDISKQGQDYKINKMYLVNPVNLVNPVKT